MTNIAEIEWRRTLNAVGADMLTDSPKCKSIFAFGAGSVLKHLRKHCDAKEWEKVRSAFADFTEAYMVESVKRKAS